MRILILILARKGSKRIIKKNIKLLGKKPLISWTLEIAKKLNFAENILVSTDSSHIKKISLKYKVMCPWLRPSYLAKDKTKSETAAMHALNWYEKKHGLIDGVLLLQPTSPFRSLYKIKEGFNLFKKNNKKAVIGVSKIENNHYIKKLFKFNKNLLTMCNKKDQKKKISKFFVNGSFYLVNSSQLKNKNGFVPKNFLPLMIKSEKHKIDIDTNEDLIKAKKILKK